MSGIWKINMVQNLTTKQDFNKLSFKRDDSFVARALKLDGSSSEIIIKLLDGRTFPAKVEGFINEPLENYLFKFIVDGFEEGKLKLKLLEANMDNQNIREGNEEKSLFDELKARVNFPIEKEDITIVKTMLKYNVPINEENFNEVKTITDFINKIKASPDEGEKFINKFLSAKGIDGSSEKGIDIKNKLTSFFNEVKKLDLNSLLMMKESNISITESNIKSFINVATSQFDLFNEVTEAKTVLDGELNSNIEESFDNTMKKVSSNNANNNEASSANNKGKNNILTKELNIIADILENKEIEVSNKNVVIDNKDIEIVNKATILEDKEESKKVSEGNIKDNNSLEKGKENQSGKEGKPAITDYKDIKENLLSKVNTKEIATADGKVNIVEDLESELNLKDMLPTHKLVKDEIKDKINNLKTSIMDIIKVAEDNQNTVNKVFQLIENKLQDFKMFNTLSNDYYYLNLPMNIKEDKYDCKLVIKDERNKGKKLDSKNMKIATSIATLNMNTVDAYITVMNNNVSIEIRAEEAFTKMLTKFQRKLMEDLSVNNYNFNVYVTEKVDEFSLIKCREFFADEDFSALSVFV